MSVLHFPARAILDDDTMQVAAAIHRMNSEPGMADNPVWRDLVAYFDKRNPGNCWELPF